jgi:hypothetical protein
MPRMGTDEMTHGESNEPVKHRSPIRDIRGIRGCMLSLLKI